MAKNYQTHRFFCIKCGKEGIPLARKQGHKHERFHRKKLYCFYCKEEVNHMECRNQAEIDEFKDAFERGEFIDEAEESISYVRSTRQW